jgi:hypothetical protein
MLKYIKGGSLMKYSPNHVLGFLFCLLFLFPVSAKGADTSALPSPMAVAPVHGHEFEPVVDGAEIKHAFVIENKGSAPLLIEKVKPGCGCTTVSYDKEIPPGGKGTVSVLVNTRGYGGRRMWKRVLVETNDPENPKFYLKIGGNVEEFAHIEPHNVQLMGPSGKALTQQVSIVPLEKHPFTIVGVMAEHGDNIRFKLETVKTPQATKFLLTIENLRKEKGRYRDLILLKTDSPVRPEIRIGVYGHIKGR